MRNKRNKMPRGGVLIGGGLFGLLCCICPSVLLVASILMILAGIIFLP
ncbi:MAG: hypothetical protein ACOX60_05585 [Massiliimalia sp.]|jgi:hypothetical protein